jgi:hypothetical protein
MNGFSGDRCNVCELSCQNDGILNSTLCLCECTDRFTGTGCETVIAAINLGVPEYIGIGIASGVVLLVCVVGLIWAFVSDCCMLSTWCRKSTNRGY